MKKIFIYTLFSLVFGLSLSSTVLADLIPPNSHSLNRCIKIVNLNEFSDMYLIGYITGPMVDGHEAYIYKEGECLSMGYKFNQLKLLLAKKSYIDSIGLNNLQVQKVQTIGNCPGGCYSEELSDKNVFVSDEKIYPYGGYVDQENPLIKEKIEYSISGYSNGKLTLYKSKQTSEYNNGTSPKTEIFPNPYQNTKPITPINTSTNTCYQFNRNLTIGSRGDDVKNLQIILGVNPSTGYFGQITNNAVKEYQIQNNIYPTLGYVGPLTRAKLNTCSNRSSTPL